MTNTSEYLAFRKQALENQKLALEIRKLQQEIELNNLKRRVIIWTLGIGVMNGILAIFRRG